MATPASTGLSVSPARPPAPVLPKALVVIDQSDMYTNVFSRFADGRTDTAGMFGWVYGVWALRAGVIFVKPFRKIGVFVQINIICFIERPRLGFCGLYLCSFPSGVQYYWFTGGDLNDITFLKVAGYFPSIWPWVLMLAKYVTINTVHSRMNFNYINAIQTWNSLI